MNVLDRNLDRQMLTAPIVAHAQPKRGLVSASAPNPLELVSSKTTASPEHEIPKQTDENWLPLNNPRLFPADTSPF